MKFYKKRWIQSGIILISSLGIVLSVFPSFADDNIDNLKGQTSALESELDGINKGTGLVNLGSRLGIKREEIMAFGDGDNDTVMLKEVGFGVAMANGEPQVKEAADYITLSNEEDGVAQAIERFVLGGGEARC